MPKKDFIGDAFWVYGYDPETKHQSLQWKHTFLQWHQKVLQSRRNVKSMLTILRIGCGLQQNSMLISSRDRFLF